jgi:hypothetical protein
MSTIPYLLVSVLLPRPGPCLTFLSLIFSPPIDCTSSPGSVSLPPPAPLSLPFGRFFALRARLRLLDRGGGSGGCERLLGFLFLDLDLCLAFWLGVGLRVGCAASESFVGCNGAGEKVVDKKLGEQMGEGGDGIGIGEDII